MLVGDGATLGLGCSPGAIGPKPPCGTSRTSDTVGGNIIANQPLTMYLTATSIRGSVVSIGGGPGPVFSPYINYPIKENVIGGNLLVAGWKGAWFGVLRNSIGGNAVLLNNVGVTISEETHLPDSSEIVSNSISGNLVCFGNQPAAQVQAIRKAPRTTSAGTSTASARPSENRRVTLPRAVRVLPGSPSCRSEPPCDVEIQQVEERGGVSIAGRITRQDVAPAKSRACFFWPVGCRSHPGGVYYRLWGRALGMYGTRGCRGLASRPAATVPR